MIGIVIYEGESATTIEVRHFHQSEYGYMHLHTRSYREKLSSEPLLALLQISEMLADMTQVVETQQTLF